MATATGLEKPKNVGQEDEEQELEPEWISLTEPEEVSLVTQMLPETSTAIPVGEVNPEKVGQEEGEEQEPEAAAEDVISVTEPEEEVSLVTQMFPKLSTAIPVGEVNPENVLQEEEEVQEVVLDVISVTELEDVFVTQTLWLESTAIPAGVNPREMRGQSAVVAQEVALAGISMRPPPAEAS